MQRNVTLTGTQHNADTHVANNYVTIREPTPLRIWRFQFVIRRRYPGSQKTPWRMTGFWSYYMTPTYVMLNPQCNVTGNTRMIA